MCKYCLEAAKEHPEITQVTKEVFPNWDNHNFNGGYVYFFTNEDLSLIKVGYSKDNPYGRMKMYEYEMRKKYSMLAVWPVVHKETEKHIHDMFKSLRVHREFFKFTHDFCGLLKGLWMTFSLGMQIQPIDELWGINWLSREQDRYQQFRRH